MPVLQVLNGPQQWKTFRVAGPRFLIGRRDNCHLVIKDGWVSREHTVLIESTTGEFLVQDLQSENGSFLNGKRVTEAPLRDRDQLRIGRTELLFLLAGRGSPEEGLAAAPSTGTIEVDEVSDDSGSQTVAVGSTARKGPDLRDRIRRLEKALLQKEEEIARLAAENAVVKRALAGAGLLDPEGRPDLERMATPSPTLLAHPAVVRQTTNPRARILWPLDGGGVLSAGTFDEDADAAQGVVHLNVLGMGTHGAGLADAFYRLGYQHALSLCPVEDLPEHASLPAAAHVNLAVPMDPSDETTARRALTDQKPALANVFRAELWERPDLQLMACGAGEILGASCVTDLVDVLEEYESLVAGRDGGTRPPKGVLAMLPAQGSGDGQRATTGLRDLERLFDAWRLKLLLLVEQDRVQRLLGAAGREGVALGHHLVASLVDAANRLPYMDPLAGDVSRDRARGFLLEGGIATFGLGASKDPEQAALEQALQFAFKDGLLAAVSPALAREVMILALVGKNLLARGTGLLERLTAVCEKAGTLVPQARSTTGVFVDAHDGIRFTVCLGGLPFPGGNGS